MYFRSMKKTAGDVSLSDCIETGKDGNALSLMDVLCSDEDLFEDLSTRQTYKKLYEVMDEVLSERERMVVTLRYGLGDRTPLTQREIAAKCGISRSYVSRIEKKRLPRFRKRFRITRRQTEADFSWHWIYQHFSGTMGAGGRRSFGCRAQDKNATRGLRPCQSW